MATSTDTQSASPVERFVNRVFRVGDELYYHPRDKRYTGRTVAVTAVGRKWVSLSNHERFDRTQEMSCDYYAVDGRGYTPSGDVFVSKCAWSVGERVRLLLRDLSGKIERSDRRADLTPEDVLKAAKILRITLSD